MTLILSNDEVNSVLTMPDCIDILEDAYREMHAGAALTRRRSDCLVPSDREGAIYGFKTMDGVIPSQGVLPEQIEPYEGYDADEDPRELLEKHGMRS